MRKNIVLLFVLIILESTTFAQTELLKIDLRQSNPTSENYVLDKTVKVDLNGSDFEVELINQEWEEIEISKVNIGLLKHADVQMEQFSAANQKYLRYSSDRFKFENNSVYELKSVTVAITPITNVIQKNSFAENSILSKGKWIKVSSTKKGIHSITYDRLKEMGITNPVNLSVYGNGGQMLPKYNNVDYPDDLVKNPVVHSKNKDGKDAVFFYSTGTYSINFNSSLAALEQNINLYSDKAYYFLTEDMIPSEEPMDKAIVNGDPENVVSDFTEVNFIEDEKNNLIKSGRKWFGDRFLYGTSKNYDIAFNGITTGVKSKLIVSAAHNAREDAFMVVYSGNELIDSIKFTGFGTSLYGIQATTNKQLYQVQAKNNYTVGLLYAAMEQISGEAWIDYICINQNAKLSLINHNLNFRNEIVLEHDYVEYSLSDAEDNTVVWDVTNPWEIQNVNWVKNGNGLKFTYTGKELNEFVAFVPNKGSFDEPVFVENVDNQNIHGLNACDMIIVSQLEYMAAAEALAEHHRASDDMDVEIVDINDVYNEFASGLPDVAAIRNMVKMFYERQKNTNQPLRYLLLMGDGSYNNWNLLASTSLMPTYQSNESINVSSSFQTDDFFGLLDDNEGEYVGMLDIGVGRIPCKSKYEAWTVVDKIINYASSAALGDWRNVVCFIADDQDVSDGVQFMRQSEEMIDTIQKKYPGFYTEKIYLDAFQQVSSSSGDTYPDVNEAINRRVEEGVLILNYIGHANPSSIAHEDVVKVDDINSWSNTSSLPVFVTATCEFSRFDDDSDSAGELVILNPTGGGVALFSTTRVVYSGGNAELLRHFYSNVFKQYSTGEKYRMGDIMRFSKNATGSSTNINKRNFTLLSDPALKLAFPEYKVITTSINNKNPEVDDIEIGALDKVTIQGQIQTVNGELIPDFEGELSTTIYDKEVSVETLANDGGSPFEFTVQSNIIYKGKSTVKDGKFEFTFIVPKDINYKVDNGKIFYYANNKITDANGSTEQFEIGGTSASPIVDNDSPLLKGFINSTDFKPNDKVATNALLLVDLYDQSGINTVGAGIGHDIIAVLDNDYGNEIVLNDYYSSKSDSFQRGTILYPLNNLSSGKHSIKIKAWDVQNNSSEIEVSFIVEDGFKVISVKNAPNPVTTYTDFKIAHNLPGDKFDVLIELFSLSGRKVVEINESVGSYNSALANIRWNTSDSYIPAGDKLLVYTISLTSTDGLKATGTGKLILNRN